MSIQIGFTLIELIIVIALIAILVVVAMPSYEDFSGSAQDAVSNSVAGSLSSANAENYTIRNVNKKYGSAINNCNQLANLLTGGLPNGYSIRSTRLNPNVSKECTLRTPSAKNIKFTGTGIS